MTEARLKVEPSEKLIKYSHIPRLEREKKHFYEYIDVDLAHTVMLVEKRILSKEEGSKIFLVLCIRFRGKYSWLRFCFM